MKLKHDDFRMWLASHEGHETPFGTFVCPLMAWLESLGHEQVDVGFTSWFKESEQRSLPEWARAFVGHLDDACDQDWSSLTAKRALEILDGVE